MNGSVARRDSVTAIFAGTLIVGIVALCAARIWHFESGAMYSLAAGCIPAGALGTGLSMWAPRWAARNRPEWIERKRTAMDERRVQVQHHAGYAAFWVFFVYLGIYTALSPTRLIASISPHAFGSATLVIMPLAYWIAVFIYNRKY